MSQTSTHHHSLLNSTPQTHHHHQPNLTAPIKSENDSDDDDVVFLSSVPKVVHIPEDYDPECQCSTCQLVRKLMEKCTCEECRGQQTNQVNQGQVVELSENVPIANAVSPTNGQLSSSSVQNNDASTSEHTNANYLDDERPGSSTPDYLPPFFDDESGDSSSDDSDDEDYVDNKVEQESESLNSIVHAQETTSYQKVTVTNGDTSGSSDNESTNLYDELTESSPVKCPKCAKTFKEKGKILRHYRAVHQEWKPYYCRWPKCNFASAIDDIVIGHAYRTHLNLQNRQKARKYVGKRKKTLPHDPVLEQIVAIKFGLEKKKRMSNTVTSVCPQCGRNLSAEHMKSHILTHANVGYRCAWPKCGFFYSLPEEVKKHFLLDHLGVNPVPVPTSSDSRSSCTTHSDLRFFQVTH